MNKNLVLAIDTSGACLSVALAENQRILASYNACVLRGQSEVLMPRIQELFEKSHREMRELSALAAAVGPGSFTGVRIGLAAAKGLALALDIPLAGISCFHIAAANAQTPCLVALDTRRGDFYTQLFQASQSGTPQILKADDIMKTNLPIITDKPEVFSNTAVKILPFPASPAEQMISIYQTQKEVLLPPVAYYMRDAEVTLASKK